MAAQKTLPTSRKERTIRAFILLAASALFSTIAWLAGAYDLSNQNWTYLCIVGIVGAAAIVSRFGAKWAMRHLPDAQTQKSEGLPRKDASNDSSH